MGDFEDIFGAGADAVDIIENINRAEIRWATEEARREKETREDEITEQHLWFPDYASALAWEIAHKDISFSRRPHQGGFEVTFRDWRSKIQEWRNTSMSDLPAERGELTLVYAEGLGDRLVSRGAFRVRLAKETASMLVGVLQRLRNEVPFGRASLSPIWLTIREFRDFFRSMPDSLSFDLELGGEFIAVFCEDHHLLIGRRVNGDEVQIWPWILELECGGGKVDVEGRATCFLCDHHCLEEGYIPDNTHFDVEAFNHSAPSTHHHFITKDQYTGGVRPKDLANCVKEWIALFEPLDRKIGPTQRTPDSVLAVLKETAVDKADLDNMCRLLACAVALRENLDEVSVSLCATSDFASISQSKPVGLTLSWGEVSGLSDWKLFDGAEPASLPFLSRIKCHSEFPEWRDLVDLYPVEQSLPVRRCRNNFVAHGDFTFAGLNSEQRLQAKEIVKAFLEQDLPPLVREFLDPVGEA